VVTGAASEYIKTVRAENSESERLERTARLDSTLVNPRSVRA
jgi:hypothetical protein